MRRSDSLRTFSPHLVLLRLAIPSRAPVFVSPSRPDADLGPGALCLAAPTPQPIGMEPQGVPSSWGTLMCLCRVLRPRRDRNHQAIAVDRRGPRSVQAKGSRGWYSRGSIARPEHWLSTLRRVAHTTLRKTRFRPLARLYRVGLITPRVPLKGFEGVFVTSPPPFPGFAWRKDSSRNCLPRKGVCQNSAFPVPFLSRQPLPQVLL